jgi:hypothetical protein
MQGKFQMKILSIKVGHCIQEDAPEETASSIINFIKKFIKN